MVIKICPRCQQRILVNSASDDVVHICNSGNDTLDNEDVKVVGDWSDYTGSGIKQNANMQGIGNKLFGTRAALEGANDDGETKRGNNAALVRQRQHEEFIDGC